MPRPGSRWAAQLLGIALLLVGTEPAAGQCWELQLADGTVVRAEEIWQSRNRIDGHSSLLGKVNGRLAAIRLTEIESLVVSASDHQPLLKIRHRDGRHSDIRSELTLQYLAGDERGQIPLAQLSGATRCPGPVSTETTSASSATTANPLVRRPAAAEHLRIYLANGDQLRGRITDERLEWNSAYGVLGISPDQVLYLATACPGSARGMLQTVAGDRVQGVLAGQPLTVLLDIGATLSIRPDEVAWIARSGPEAGVAKAAICGERVD